VSKKPQPADLNEDGLVTPEEIDQYKRMLRAQREHKRENDQRRMAWFALFGMLLYPAAVVLASYVGLLDASKILGDMAPTYFVSVAAIVAAFYGKEAYSKKVDHDKGTSNYKE
jgi:hypothetical protein